MRRVLEPRGVHDREHVLAPVLQRWRNPKSVGEPDASLVEHRDADVVALIFERSPVELLLPDQLDVRDHGRDDEHDQGRIPTVATRSGARR